MACILTVHQCSTEEKAEFQATFLSVPQLTAARTENQSQGLDIILYLHQAINVYMTSIFYHALKLSS